MPAEPFTVYWQAHRGGGAYEAPDNTMAANRYTWGLGGIPEADIRTTRDGIMVCLHDETPARTTDAPNNEKDRPISSFSFAETRSWDAGCRFHERFAGEQIPSLEEVFSEMRGHPERLLYLDLKDVDLNALGALIDRWQVNHQVIFAHHLQESCVRMKQIADGVRTMLWIGGSAAKIQQKFLTAQTAGFSGLDQVQLHLNSRQHQDQGQAVWPYEIDPAFLSEALQITKEAGLDLEVLPFQLHEEAIHTLLELGIRWFATEEPSRFLDCVSRFKI